MTQSGSRRLFALGMRLAHQAARQQTRWQTRQVEIRQQIATLLAEQAGLEIGIERLDFAAMPEGERRRLFALADRALAGIDPENRSEAQREAIGETLGWAAGLEYAPRPEDIITEAVHRYEAALSASAPVLGAPCDATVIGKCRICSGTVYREGNGPAICDNCGREVLR